MRLAWREFEFVFNFRTILIYVGVRKIKACTKNMLSLNENIRFSRNIIASLYERSWFWPKKVPFVARFPEALPFPKNPLVLKRNKHHSTSPDLATTPQCRLALGCSCLSYSPLCIFSNLESYSPYERWWVSYVYQWRIHESQWMVCAYVY